MQEMCFEYRSRGKAPTPPTTRARGRRRVLSLVNRGHTYHSSPCMHQPWSTFSWRVVRGGGGRGWRGRRGHGRRWWTRRWWSGLAGHHRLRCGLADEHLLPSTCVTTPDDVGRGGRRAGARTSPRLIRASRSSSVNSPCQLAASFVTSTATSFGATFWMSAAGTDVGASLHETFLRPVQSERCGSAARRTRGRGRAGLVGRVSAELLRAELDRLGLAPRADRRPQADRAHRGNIVRDVAEPRDEALHT